MDSDVCLTAHLDCLRFCLVNSFRLELKSGSPVTDELSSESDNVFLVEDGEVRFDVEGESYELGEGDSVHLRGGVLYRFVNAGKSDVSMFQFTTDRRTMPMVARN